MNKNKPLLLLLCLILSCLCAEAETPQKVFTVRSAVETALANNPMGLAAKFQVQRAGLNVKKAQYQSYLPKLNFNLDTGFVPEARGDIFYSPDKSDELNGFGPFYRIDLKLVQPLFTFGRISSAIEATRYGESLAVSEREQILEKLALEVIETYWGLASAIRAESVALDLRDNYEKLLREVRERLEDEDSAVDDLDLLEVKAYNFSVEENYRKAYEMKTLSSQLFNALLYIDLDTPIATSGEPTPEFVPEKAGLDRSILAAQKFRPGIKAIEAAAEAVRAKTDLAKSQRYPLIFLSAGVGLAQANNRTDQDNPFVVDNFNYKRVAAAFGVSWDLNLIERNVDVMQAEAEHRAVLERLKALKTEVAVEVNRAFLEAERNSLLLESARKSLKAAKTWLRVSLENWDLGIGEVRRMLRAYTAYYSMERTVIEYEYRLNASLAKLAYILGDTKLYLDWVQHGKVTLKNS
jgi:outer membrane protein